jgi:AraC family transcriptional regulator of adaptative response/methylated-DNA-[protein]-cysteine methyltransferase
MSETIWWDAIQRRDPQFDSQFVYGVRTTGVYCRPSCASRRPLRRNVAFFATASAAEQAGFRPCRRCRPQVTHPDDPQVDLAARVCRYLDEPRERIPTLAELSVQFHISPYHLQRTFKRVIGISPRQYADARRQERLRLQLQAGDAVTGAGYDAGYASSSSLYAQAGATLGMTPGAYRRGGPAEIAYTIAPCPLGLLLVAATARGICKVGLGDDAAALEADLRREFPAATARRDDAALGPWIAAILAHLRGEQPHLDLPLDIRATAFQRKVWEALRAIPYGETRSYTEVARGIGQPAAQRAVARACATNPVALVIPCHRVVREDGGLGGYRWGLARKRALLAGEQASGRRDEKAL